MENKNFMEIIDIIDIRMYDKQGNLLKVFNP